MEDEINLLQSGIFQHSYYFSYKHFHAANSYLQNSVHLHTPHTLK